MSFREELRFFKITCQHSIMERILTGFWIMADFRMNFGHWIYQLYNPGKLVFLDFNILMCKLSKPDVSL